MSSAPRLHTIHSELHADDADVVGGIRVKVAVPDTVAPFAGAVSETVGGAVSGTGAPPIGVTMSV